MTTALDKPLAREVVLSGAPFKVIISPSGVRISEKGRRKGSEVTWDTILALGQASVPTQNEFRDEKTDLPKPIAHDVAREVRVANEALGRAGAALLRAGNIPPSLLNEFEPDQVYGRTESNSDWFIEPLLTVAEVASILRVSKALASRLPIRSLSIEGERRYRQSEVRRYIADQENPRSVLGR